GVDAEEPPGYVPGGAQRARERHVDAVIVEWRQVQRRKGAAAEHLRPAARLIEQGLERVGVTLGLHQAVALERSALTHRAIDRRDERARVGVRRACPRAQRAREEGVERLVLR